MAYLTGGKVPRADILHTFAWWNINIYASVYKQKNQLLGHPLPAFFKF